MPSNQRRFVYTVFVAFALMLLSLYYAAHHGFIWNTTASMPIGVYKLTDQAHGKLLLFCPQGDAAKLTVERGYRVKGDMCRDGYAPLLKPIVATAGDTVTLTRQGIAVNGHSLPNSAPKPTDSHGNKMPLVPPGTYTVAERTVWVVSSYNSNSFDSRYFGPVSLSDAISYAKPILTF